MSDDFEWYLRRAAYRALQGLPVTLPVESEPEQSNVHSIEAARTRRATQMMLGRATRERPL